MYRGPIQPLFYYFFAFTLVHSLTTYVSRLPYPQHRPFLINLQHKPKAWPWRAVEFNVLHRTLSNPDYDTSHNFVDDTLRKARGRMRIISRI